MSVFDFSILEKFDNMDKAEIKDDLALRRRLFETKFTEYWIDKLHEQNSPILKERIIGFKFKWIDDGPNTILSVSFYDDPIPCLFILTFNYIQEDNLSIIIWSWNCGTSVKEIVTLPINCCFNVVYAFSKISQCFENINL